MMWDPAEILMLAAGQPGVPRLGQGTDLGIWARTGGLQKRSG